MLDVFMLPVIIGSLEITLILYNEPAAAPPGIVAFIVPEVVEARVPILVGDAKLPDEFDNCAVNTLPELNEPHTV